MAEDVRHAAAPSARAVGPGGGSVAAAARVLVVDDIEANRAILIRRLTRLGVGRIAEAADGRAALDAIAAEPFDLVLLDIMMPVMTGFDVLETLGARGRTADPPVIVISALNEMDATVRAIALGAEDFLLKPFDPLLLRARVLATLEKKQLRDRLRDELGRKRAELAEARDLQLALVPPPFARGGIRVDALLDPAREVGGDLVDHLALPDGRHLLVVGDVSDKGAAAALTMARTHALIRSLAGRPDAATLLGDLAGVAGDLNAALAAGNAGCMFVTALIALFDPAEGRLDCVRCGHVPPFVRRAHGGVERLSLATGLPLGVSELAAYVAGTTQLDSGDTLLLVSDGVTEAEDPSGTMFGDGRAADWLQGGGEAAAALAAAVRTHEAGGPPSDDLAVLLMHVDARGTRGE